MSGPDAPDPVEGRRRAVVAAEVQGTVISRAELRSLGLDRHAVRREVRAGRWRTHGHQTVAVHTTTLPDMAQRWRAIWEVGIRIAALDGVTALQQAGLKNFTEDTIHVSIPQGSRPYEVTGVRTHPVVGRSKNEVIRAGIPRTRTPVAAIRAAQWAKSDRQAALILCMVIQQRLTTPAQLSAAAVSTRTRGRAAFVRRIVTDLSGGVQALSELDFASLCRSRRLPEPSRQVVRTTAKGRAYLDVAWEDIGLVVEINGAQHQWGLAVTDDNLRLNSVVIGGEVVLRIDLIGMRIDPDAFMDQVVVAHDQQTQKHVA